MPAIDLSRKPGNTSFFFIADLHSLTTVHDREVLRHNTYVTAAAWLACGFDADNQFFYRQSDVPFVTELTWHLGCFFPFTRLSLAHSFKDKQDKLNDVSSGLFYYPVLMAADILMYDAEFVPVGKDQKQHLEITRDIASRFNNQYGETLVLPEPLIGEDVGVIPGIDGAKMSKSYGNHFSIFEPEKDMRKKVMKIVTDATPMEEPKNPDTCNVYNIYKHIATPEQRGEMRKLYEGGNFGYGTAKTMLFELLLSKYAEERKAFDRWMSDLPALDKMLALGAKKAAKEGAKVLARVRDKVGYHPSIDLN